MYCFSRRKTHSGEHVNIQQRLWCSCSFQYFCCVPLKQQAHIVCHLLSVITTFYTVVPSVGNVQHLYQKGFN